ncbi:hypothetical protein IID19_02985 [Patescibacteria group bacterium]|nr:hypothetical protein [Patescibacteria group bacterium]
MNNKGLAIFAVVSFLGIILTLTLSLIVLVMSNRTVTQRGYNIAQARSISEAGIDKAIWCLNNEPECGTTYTGETTSIGNGSFTTVLTGTGNDYAIESTGTINNINKKIKATITTKTVSAGAAFFFGVQVGEGGLDMANGSTVVGNVYSNGSVTAGNGARVTGDIFVAGGTALSPDQQQTIQATDYLFGNIEAKEDVAQSFQAGTTEVLNYISLYIKKVGNPNNAKIYITNDNSGSPDTTAIASGTLYSSLLSTSYAWLDIGLDTTPQLTSGQTYWIVINTLVPKSTRYYVIGENVDSSYSSGTAKKSSNWSSDPWNDVNNDFTFKTWMGGIDTSIDNLEVGDKDHTCDDAHYATHHGDAYANSITNSEIECDAFFDVDPDDISGTTVGRNKNSGSPDPPPEPLPISDARIQDWKDIAEAGGTFTGDKIIDGTSTSLGPLKITGSLTITNSAVLTITGNLWIQGDIIITNNTTIKLDPGYGSSSGTVITDGQVDVNNNNIFEGSGDPDSYILILTTNNSLDNASPAININNNAQTVIFYAGNGLIKIGQNSSLREATGYKLRLDNNASVDYVSGLANANFSNGPGGIWTTKKSSWLEID